jgi:BirA family transcriptional regulator, biotin operon repressor / biotin---[acetyl-CoA-carboxylase] ligase
MAVYTDNPDFAARLLAAGGPADFVPAAAPAPLAPVLAALFHAPAALAAAPAAVAGWRDLAVCDFAAASQYDALIGLARAGVALPDRLACVARSGNGFHGFKGRSWSACPGNIHLTVHLAPDRPIPRFDTAFIALAAVSVAEAVDALPGLAGRARFKWVNDVLVEGAKVAGVLAYTHTREHTVTGVVLGIGVNVETTPRVERDAFVPAAGSLRELAPDPAAVELGATRRGVLAALARNYDGLLAEGWRPLLERYRARSAVLGQHVTICTDDGTAPPRILAAGRVTGIGEGLELELEGRAEPVRGGRLILGPLEGQP